VRARARARVPSIAIFYVFSMIGVSDESIDLRFDLLTALIAESAYEKLLQKFHRNFSKDLTGHLDRIVEHDLPRL